MTGQNDYSIREDGQHIGRIRFASERTPGIWIWHSQVHIPGPPFGSARSLDEARRTSGRHGWRSRRSTARRSW
jgi:hypothetical protein